MTQISFFQTDPSENLIQDGELYYFRDYWSFERSAEYFERLIQQMQWKQEEILLFGKKMKTPRLSAWYGDPEAVYRYSNTDFTPLPWIDVLKEIQRDLRSFGFEFNSVLANLYRDGSDSMGCHSDDEPELGKEPVIASVNFGQERSFIFEHKRKSFSNVKLSLENGSLLIMKGKIQENWKHKVPKSKRKLKPRISLTFRKIYHQK